MVVLQASDSLTPSSSWITPGNMWLPSISRSTRSTSLFSWRDWSIWFTT